MAKQSKARAPSPTARSGPRSTGWPSAPGCRPRGWPNAPASTPPRSTNPSASPADGRERWPSTESVSKALAATNSSIDTFVQLIGDGARSLQSVPLLGFAQAGSGGYFDDSGFPAGKGWDEVALPAASDEHAYALEISGDSMKPAYRDGDIIVVSPGTPIRRGDRVVVKTTAAK